MNTNLRRAEPHFVSSTASRGRLFSRREWLTWLSSASLSTVLLGQRALAAEPAPQVVRAATDLGARTYNVREFGAKGDGVTLDTAAVQAAINACHADQGGTVLIPAGVFVIGTVELKSNVTLHISAQGKLLGSADGKHYHAIAEIPLSGDTSLNDGNVGMLYAVHAENITLEGPGTIDGQGSKFRIPEGAVRAPSGTEDSDRPYQFLFYRCKNLAVRDVFLTAGAIHAVRIIQSSYVQLTGLHIHNRVNRNNDGFHFISSDHVHISNCDVECQDDACALFGSCKFVTVDDCSFSTRWSVFRFGGGQAENIAVSNCLIHETYGCPIKMVCSPEARFENMAFSNLVMRNVTGPISITQGPHRPARARPPGGQEKTGASAASEDALAPGVVRNISFRGIQATVVVPIALPDTPFTTDYHPAEIKSCIGLSAVDGFLENISFEDVQVMFPGGGTEAEAAVRDVPLVIGEYYEAGVLPAYALFARNVRGLRLSNVRFQVAGAEARPAVVLDHVIDAAFNGFTAQGTKEAESLLRLIDAQDVLLAGSRVLDNAAVFLDVEGASSSRITVEGGDLSRAAKVVAFNRGADVKSVKLVGG
ncbi:MAG TPA: glycosyl hydrolase family 28 protein [Verrucomicrobiae bacterium]|nr:glycosyl hydrolase family 28 protein [Verrucomicrobiae bacterium]